MYMLGKIYFRQNRFVEAEKQAVKAIDLETQQDGYHFLLGRIYQRQGRQAQAAAEFEKVKTIQEQKRARENEVLNQIPR